MLVKPLLLYLDSLSWLTSIDIKNKQSKGVTFIQKGPISQWEAWGKTKMWTSKWQATGKGKWPRPYSVPSEEDKEGGELVAGISHGRLHKRSSWVKTQLHNGKGIRNSQGCILGLKVWCLGLLLYLCHSSLSHIRNQEGERMNSLLEMGPFSFAQK